MPGSEPPRRPVGGLLLMAVFAVWSGGLGVGFAAVAIVAHDRLGPLRLTAFIVLAAVLVLAAVRTSYELAQRMRRPEP